MGFPRQEYWSGLPFQPRDQTCLLCCRRVLSCWTTREVQGLTSSIKWLREGSLNTQPLLPLWLIWDGPMAWAFPKCLNGKELASQCKDMRDAGSIPGFGKIPLEEGMVTTPVFLPAKSHGQKSLVAYSLWGHKESDMTEVWARMAWTEPVWEFCWSFLDRGVRELLFMIASYEGGGNLVFTCLVFSCSGCIRLFVTSWTVVRQAPQPMGFLRQEYRSGFPSPSPEDLPNLHCRRILYQLGHQGNHIESKF